MNISNLLVTATTTTTKGLKSNLEQKKAHTLHMISLINKDELPFILRIKDMNSFQENLQK